MSVDTETLSIKKEVAEPSAQSKAAFAAHAKRLISLQIQMKSQAGTVQLQKKTTNLFRHRKQTKKARLDVRCFNHVLEVNAKQGYVIAEGMTTFDDLVKATLAHGCLPAVVPELKTITLGGALVGIGIESSSFRYGLVHETVLAADVLLGDASVVHCDANNKHRDLFFALPNSYGTLGYALQVKMKLVAALPYVRLQHYIYNDNNKFYNEMQQLAVNNHKSGPVDFIDATHFSKDEMVITTANFSAKADKVSDYTYKNIFYRSLRELDEDTLTTYDYIWRWDTDWFWCSRVFGAQNPIIRRLFGRKRLNSRFYRRLMSLANKNRLLALIQRWFAKPSESVIQDVCVPIENAAEFLDFFNKQIGIKPLWNCPLISFDKNKRYPLFAYQQDKMLVNFGFWDTVPTKKEQGYYNRLIEAKVHALGGMKSLYSNSFYTKQQFWDIYNGDAYTALKKKYDPQGRLGDLYQKCIEKVV